MHTHRPEREPRSAAPPVETIELPVPISNQGQAKGGPEQKRGPLQRHKHKEQRQANKERRSSLESRHVEVIQDLAVRKLKGCPGNRAVHQVAAQKAQETPTLGMFHHQVLAQTYSSATGSQPVSQLDVFDARPPIGFVKTLQFLEHRLLNGAASGPERGAFRRGELMHEVVCQVFVTRKEIVFGWVVVVGSDNRSYVRLLLECPLDRLQSIRETKYIRIHEEENGSAGLLGPAVSSDRRALARRERDNPVRELPGDFRRVIGGAVIHQDELKVPMAGARKRLQAALQVN